MTLPAGTPTEMFVDGKWIGGSAGPSRCSIRRPATEIASVPIAGDDDVRRAVSAAATAQPEWAAAAPRERSEVLRKTFELMHAHADDLAYLMSLEMGKSLTDAKGEVTYSAEFFRWFAEEAVRVGRRAAQGAVRREPDPDLPQAGGRRAAADAVELPGGDGDAQDRPGAGGRLHVRAQAGR